MKNETRRKEWDWKSNFTREVLRQGEKDAKSGKIIDFAEEGNRARGLTERRFNVNVYRIPTTVEELEEYPRWDNLRGGEYHKDDDDYFARYYLCDCSQGINGARCRHLASLMYYWEMQHGPFIMEETEEQMLARLKREEEAEIRKRKQEIRLPVEDFVAARRKPIREHLTFSPDKILKKSALKTSELEAEQADQLSETEQDKEFRMDIHYESDGQSLNASIFCWKVKVEIRMSQQEITYMGCSCGNCRLKPVTNWYLNRVEPAKMCAHALAFWLRLRDRIVRENPGDETDLRGYQLMNLMTGSEVTEGDSPEKEQKAAPKETVRLIPRIIREKGYGDGLILCFDVEQGEGSRPAALLKKLEDLVSAVEDGEKLEMTKAVAPDFSMETFTADSRPWYELIRRRVKEIEKYNRAASNKYGYYFRTVSAGNGIPMEMDDLDEIFEIGQGGKMRVQRSSRNDFGIIQVRETHPRIRLTLDPWKDGTDVIGVILTGEIPRLLQGQRYEYVLDDQCFGRVSRQEVRVLGLLKNISEKNGQIRCRIGVKKFPEFYYRVLPLLQDAEEVEIIDHVGQEILKTLPPEPEFVFWIDLEEHVVSCRGTVRYGTEEMPLGFLMPDETGRRPDQDQENRVVKAVREYFPGTDKEGMAFVQEADEESLIRIMTEGVEALSRLGEVKGSDAFRRIQIRPVPQARFSVSLESGLLELSIQTRDLSEEELLELLKSYKLKKRWHRLRSGDYIDMRNAGILGELEDTAAAMQVSMEELIHGGVKLPKYRSLYVDRLLEAHDELVASRDRQFKALIRSFQTIRDSDFEVSPRMTDILRPYQNYGFRWLSTLAQSGFGGILADEMGLGKTVQMLSFLLTQFEAGERRPSLVVCPASLVYNWKEEARKFAPDLPTAILAGNLAQRTEQLAELKKDQRGTLYITSYDLLKRDITLYNETGFGSIILDEAQYIKNQKAQISKAVRVLHGEHRFALTGTPIENRLSELWSIFDFLMPGFLYSSSEFTARFETPIMKNKDEEATARLSRMTEPFILRRKKQDVLKDLPEKLEEHRSAAMDTEQRRLYDAQVVRMREVLESSGDSGEDKMRILAEITRLRQLCCDPALLFDHYTGGSAKREACLELIQSAIDGGHRMLVFSQFTSMLDLLAADLRENGIAFYTITGSTPKQERIRLVNQFNDGSTPVFLISLKAGGTGLNLTGADVVIHYDPWWNLAVQNQATDRAHRIGQTRQVTVIKLIAANTIEEKIVALQEAKRDLAEAIISGESNSLMSMSREELMALLE